MDSIKLVGALAFPTGITIIHRAPAHVLTAVVTDMAESQGTGNTAPTLTTVSVLVSIMAFVTYMIRIFVKLHKSSGWAIDDSAISIGLVMQIVPLF